MLIAVCTPVDVLADIASDEDELFYERTVAPGFKKFRAKHGRYPKTWTELRVQSSCSGYQVGDPQYYPKSDEAIIWTPKACRLSYKIQATDKRSFRVVALAKGRVVSINDTFRVTYLKTPYHNHGPYECPAGSTC